MLAQTLALRSGADTSLIGATGRADRIIASVGRDLRLETLQDASTYDAKQQSIGVKANICVYGYCRRSVSGHVAQGRMNGDFRSASEQAGLKAGDGGFQLDIARTTTLVGAAISSQTIAALNRDTSSDTLNALKPIFDKEKIEAGFEIASEAQKQVGQFLETRVRQAKALEDALKNEPEGPRRDQLKQAFEDAKTDDVRLFVP